MLNDALRMAAKDQADMDDFQAKVGLGVQTALAKQFEKYDLTAQDWAALTRQVPQARRQCRLHLPERRQRSAAAPGAYRYQILVPSTR